MKRRTCIFAAVCYFIQSVIGFVAHRMMMVSLREANDAAEEAGDPFLGLGLVAIAFAALMMLAYGIACLIPMGLKLAQLRVTHRWPTGLAIAFDSVMLLLLLTMSLGAKGAWPILIVLALCLLSFAANVRFLRFRPLPDFPPPKEGEHDPGQI